MALTPEQLAELQRLKQMYAPLVEAQRRRDQADANAQKMGIPLTPPDKKAKGGLETFLKDSVAKERMYHGTQKSFNKFKENKIGHWFSPFSHEANKYAGKDEGAQVYPVFLNVKNPLVVANRNEYNALMEKAWAQGFRGVSELAQQNNHDGILIKDSGYFNVFHPHQIKSAIGNRGTYDPNNPDITKATGGLVEFLRDSAVKHPMYHASPSGDIKAFNSWSHFGTEKAAKHIASTKKGTTTYKVHLNVRKPLRTKDHGVNQMGWWNLEKMLNDLSPEQVDWNKWHGGKEGLIADWKTDQDPSVVEDFLRRNGYDSIVYKNQVEDPGSDSYIVFDPRRVKSATGNRGTYDTTKADITKAKGGVVSHDDVMHAMRKAKSGQDYMNCKLAVQLASGVSKIQDLPKVKSPSVGDIHAFGIHHYAVDVGNGHVVDVPEWGGGIEKKPLKEVVDEYGPATAIHRPPKGSYLQHKATGGSVMGINVASDRKAGLNYADLIVDGHKTLESRNTDSLRPYVGKRVAIVRTGHGPAKAIGEVTIGEPMVVNKKKFRSLERQHMVPEGSAFDISTPTKHLYPLSDPQRYEQEHDVGHGIVARKVMHKATGGSIPSMDVMRLAIGGQGPRNFLKGTVERVIAPLKIGASGDSLELQRLLQEQADSGVEEAQHELQKRSAINQWVERNLANYIKKQMATHDDPIRKLADQRHAEIEAKHAKDLERAQRVADRAQEEPDPRRQQNMLRQSVQMRNEANQERSMALDHILHMPLDQMGYGSSQAEAVRKKHGAPRLGQSPEAQAWEDATDVAMHKIPVSLIDKKPFIGKSNWEPWMEKADPNTEVFHPTDSMHAHYLGFDHLVDVLKEDLAEGRLTPEQLNKVTIEHAVRRASEYNMERKKKMAETALKATEGMPVHKDYGDGFKWIELAMPKELPEGWSQMEGHPGIFIDPEGKNTIHNPNKLRLEDALKYEGDTMGHCVGGYCPDVAEGKTRIFSLRDAKNEPHVTVEVRPEGYRDVYRALPLSERGKINSMVEDWTSNIDYRPNPEEIQAKTEQIMSQMGYKPSESIKQIKGKGNAKPKKDYIPYVQDFVKSGNWSDVGDLQNSELIPLGGGKYGTHEEGKAVYGPRVKKAVDFLGGHPAFKEQHAAKQKRNKDLLNMDYDEQRKLESVYGQPIYPGSHYSAPELLNAIKNPEENIGGLHEYYPSLNRWLEESEKAMKHHGMADGGEVDAEEVFMGKGGKVKELEQYLRDREGEYGLKRLQRAADEIPGLENMYDYEALRSAFGGDNAQALMTMNPADFERFAHRLGSEEDESAYEGGMTREQYLNKLIRIARAKGFRDVPFLDVGKRKPTYLPSIEGHEGRHRTRALAKMGEQKTLVRLFPTPSMREPMPRRHREDFIEAMKKELGEKRLVTPEGRSLLPADLTAQEHRNLENRNLVASNRPQLPEIYKDGGEVDAESYFFPNKE